MPPSHALQETAEDRPTLCGADPDRERAVWPGFPPMRLSLGLTSDIGMGEIPTAFPEPFWRGR